MADKKDTPASKTLKDEMMLTSELVDLDLRLPISLVEHLAVHANRCSVSVEDFIQVALYSNFYLSRDEVWKKELITEKKGRNDGKSKT